MYVCKICGQRQPGALSLRIHERTCRVAPWTRTFDRTGPIRAIKVYQPK
jgi:hypothetical protein